MNPFTNAIKGRSPGALLFCRIVIIGMLPEIAHAEAMARYLSDVRFDSLTIRAGRNRCERKLRTHAERLATEASLEIEFIQNYKAFREERVKAILASRGGHPG